MPPTRILTMSRVGEPILNVEQLVVSFPTRHGPVRVVDGVGFTLMRGRTLGVVGESGCGKSMTARAILRITPAPGELTEGRIRFHGHSGLPGDPTEVDLATLPKDGPLIRSLRGDRIAMIFQEPMTSFSPVHTIGSQIIEAIRLHRDMNHAAARAHALDLLDRVRIPNPQARLDALPFQMSGGMLQRAMIAMALSCDPDILIADEPTTALDVTTQAQILDLLADLQESSGMAIMLITHNLGVVAQACHDVAVMYHGRIVEAAPVARLLNRPRHPYTRGLLKAVLLLGHRRSGGFDPIRGAVPGPGEQVSGCPFHPRCDEALERCSTEIPGLSRMSDDHVIRCLLHGDAVEEKTP